MDLNGMVSALRTPGGGFTVAYTGTWNWVEVTEGYAVATYPDEEFVTDISDVTWSRLANYIVGHLDQLRDGALFGGWHDDQTGKIYLDLATAVEELEVARVLAGAYKQVAFYNLDTGDLIRTEEGSVEAHPQTA